MRTPAYLYAGVRYTLLFYHVFFHLNNTFLLRLPRREVKAIGDTYKNFASRQKID